MERREGRELFLRVAAYRAGHGGRLPPINSDLWRDFASLEPKPRPWWRWRRDPDKRRARARPLMAFRIEKPFLTDDISPEDVEARLARWPMVQAYAESDRHAMGEWFIYLVEVLAEDLGQAMRIVDCIFAVPRGAGSPETGP